MCRYWKKDYTCEHVSGRHVDLCQPAYTNNNIICTGVPDEDELRKSYFPCYDCVREMVYHEKMELENAGRQASISARQADEQAKRDKHIADKRAKEERIRHEAREKAAKEREEEAERKAKREQEMERAKKEGGLWIETNSGKKGKGRKWPGGGAQTSVSGGLVPRSAPANITDFAAKLKGNEGTGDKTFKNENSQLNLSGRAGNWGPPKKILSRKENEEVKK